MNANLIGTQARTYTLSDKNGGTYYLEEGSFTVHFADGENLTIRHKHGSFLMSLTLAFEAFTGINLLPPVVPVADINSVDFDYLIWTETDMMQDEFQAVWQQFSQKEQSLILSDFYAWQAANS